MTHQYTITGMTCAGCEAKVKSSLLVLPYITTVEVSKDNSSGVISMEKHVPLATLQQALGAKYTITEKVHHSMEEPTTSWFTTYKPILLLFGLITAVALIAGYSADGFHAMTAMRVFMSGFFLGFSFFKLLDLEGFADNYASYDIIAKKWRGWGYVYAFIELGLGLAFALNLEPILLNGVTFVVMGISIVGVLQAVLNKRKIQCACLGAVFNLPMSTVTIIEDALMIGMSAMAICYIY
jgi:copper chaperone CopZ